MKKIIFISVFAIVALAGYSQDKSNTDKPNAEFWDAIRTKRIALFTDIIGLTPTEAQQFWPVYNAFDKERMELMNERRTLEKKLEESKTGLTQAEYQKIANDFVSTHVKEARLMETYNAKYLKILSAEKVCKLYHAERKFREVLMHELRGDKGDKKDR